MDSFREWTKKDDEGKSQTVHAVVDLAEVLAKVFKKYTQATRSRAWGRLNSEDGDKLVKDLIKNPARPLGGFRKLA